MTSGAPRSRVGSDAASRSLFEVEAALLGFEERERARRVLGTCGHDLAADQVSGLTDMVSTVPVTVSGLTGVAQPTP